MALANILLKVEKAKDEPKQVLSLEEKIFEIDILSSIDNMIKSQKVVEPLTPTSYIRSSGLGYLCPREEVLRARYKINRIETITGKQQRVFDVGHAFHAMMQNEYFAKTGMLWGHWKCRHCHKEYQFQVKPKCDCGHDVFEYVELELKSDNLLITGHPDGILVDNEGNRWLLEFKTINSMGFEVVKKSNQPKPEHIVQTNIYMGFLKLKQCLVIYFNKDTSEWYQIHTRYDVNVVKSVVSTLTDMRKAIADKDLPLPERRVCKDKYCYRAKNCPVSTMCFQQS